MVNTISLNDGLKRHEALMHELQFRDKIKSAEYHYAIGFEFDGFFDESTIVNEFFEKIRFLSHEFDFETFKLGITWPIDTGDAEKAHLKLAIQTKLIEMIGKNLSKKIISSSPDLIFLIDFPKKLVLVRMNPVYVRGKYCKYTRDIAQTEFFCNKCRGRGCWYCQDTGHFSKESVEQLLSNTFLPFFDSKLLIMHGAGREDMDVLMLGKGRPFIAELLLPVKRSANLKKIEEQINNGCKGKISISNLEFCSLGDVSTLKDTHHDKIYAALVGADKEADFSKLVVGQKMDVVQSTPTRVEKRRAILNRNKEVTILRVGEITKKEFVVVIKTSHGTYVKEFISGDNNKTKPSVSSLTGASCTCKLLDVLEICE